jgi:predicted amidohydrolase YtcJ
LPHSGLESSLTLGLSSGVGDDRFRIGPLKLFADGTLGSRTAAMLEAYDGTNDRGMDLIPADELAQIVSRAWAGGLAVAIHAIGDRAVRSSLDAFAAAARSSSRRPELPSRIEHAQLVAESDLPRFASLGIAASMQPIHCTSDRDLVERWWSGRRERSYPWQSLLGSGAPLAFGSDAPVEAPSVARGLHAAVTRSRPGDSRGSFVASQCMKLDQALTAYTEGPARLAGQWPRVGRIGPGTIADLVVWNTNLHSEPDRLWQARPILTLVDGNVFHRATDRAESAEPTAGLAR